MPAKLVQQLATGRRKRATTRVFLRPGKGQITVNHRSFENYFVSESARAYVRQPLLATETADRFDVMILAAGGDTILGLSAIDKDVPPGTKVR